VLGPTWPNHLFFLAGTSCQYAEGSDTNPGITLDCGVTRRNILSELDDAGRSYKVYDESGFFSAIVGLGAYLGAPSSIQDFVTDAANGTLPDVSIVGASTGQGLAPSEDDDHPPASVLLGESFSYRVVTALTANPATWSSSVLFLTYDEYGGFYDHVEPPQACDPDPRADSPAALRDYDFRQYGFRVPLIAISPYAKPGYVSHFDSDHTSITRFIEHVFGLGALTARDANAWPLLDLFDFDHPASSTPSFSAPPAAPACPSPPPPPTCQK
jgi:phospholipase C